MRLPQTAEYALRSMAYLATQPLDVAVSAVHLSEHTQIPSAYLSKVMRRLVLAGLVDSRKGHGGGFRLARAPQRIRIREVLAAVDYGTDGERCAFGYDECDPDKPCVLHPAWSKLKSAFERWAETTTLASALGGRR